jgi:phosphate-selective porin OprO/OprP
MPSQIHYARATFAQALAILALALVSPCWAQAPTAVATQSDLERRVKELEDIIRRLPAEKQPAATESDAALPVTLTVQPVPAAETQTLPPPNQLDGKPKATDKAPERGTGSKDDSKSDDSKPFVAGWRDGFYMQSQDKAFVLRLTGQIQADYRAFIEQADAVDIDTFLIRRARLGIEATMFQYYEFRLLPDFAPASSPVLQDAYMNIHYWEGFQFEVGKFKQPVSYEQLIQDRFVPTMERSLIDQLVPARDEGVMIHGYKLLDDRLEYALAFSNGEINGNADTNEHKDFNARVAVRPFHTPDSYWSLLQWLQIGASGGFGVEQEPINPQTLRTPATVPWFQFNSTVQASGTRSRLSPEVSYFYRGLGMAAQYYHEEQEVRPGLSKVQWPRLEQVRYDGFYYLMTYLLTGEERTTYSEAIAPLRPFNPCYPFRCPGAWEFVARTSRLNLNDGVFTPGPAQLANPLLFSKGATEMTLGFNWYFNKWVRTQFNWEHAWFDDPVQLGPSRRNLTKDSDALLTRFQIIF